MFQCPPLSTSEEIAPTYLSRSSSAPVSFFRAAVRTHPFSERGCLRKRIKFLARGFVQYASTQHWLGTLAQAEIAPLWAAHPRLSTKLQRPYVCCFWEVQDRLKALSEHYTFLPRALDRLALAQVYAEHLTLVQLRNSESKRVLAVQLFYRDQFEKEGDLTLAIDDVSAGVTLAGVTFSVVGTGADRHVIIGGLQASPGPETRVLINEVSKEMHGMRPKAFALWCLQELCATWSIPSIFAIGDDQHIYRHAHKRRDFSASYDEFWAESDGTRAANGFWQLPVRLRERQREELKASRRKAHERRYAMLNGLKPILQSAVLALQPRAAGLNTQLSQPPTFPLGKNPSACQAVEATTEDNATGPLVVEDQIPA